MMPAGTIRDVSIIFLIINQIMCRSSLMKDNWNENFADCEKFTNINIFNEFPTKKEIQLLKKLLTQIG